MTVLPSVDYHAVFWATRHAYLLLGPDLVIVDANPSYLAATMRQRLALVGQHMFDAFPDNPDDPAADGVDNLRASLDRVLNAARADTMRRQRYDIKRPDGAFEERVWDPVNLPVLDDRGRTAFILHHVVDVTANSGPYWSEAPPPRMADLPEQLEAAERSAQRMEATKSMLHETEQLMAQSKAALVATRGMLRRKYLG